MKDFTSHIDYLIQKHDCVIIPDFGGFVLNREVAVVAADGSIIPPRVSVGFNPELKYNDGLLAESYMNAYSISYDVACKRLVDAVKRLNTILNLKQSIQIGKLGKLSLDEENRLNFETNHNLSDFHPETFGLSVVDIKRLVDIQEIQKISIVTTKRSIYKRAFAGVAATAAAVLVFFVTSTPISENENRNMQRSGFFTDLISTSATLSAKTEAIPVSVDDLINSSVEEETVLITDEADAETPTEEIELKKEEPKIEKAALVAEDSKVKKTAESKFFVVIGSADSKPEAERALKKFKTQGYTNADILSGVNKSRIYIASFDDKTKAEQYLVSFRKSNPKLKDAWVFTKKN